MMRPCDHPDIIPFCALRLTMLRRGRDRLHTTLMAAYAAGYNPVEYPTETNAGESLEEVLEKWESGQLDRKAALRKCDELGLLQLESLESLEPYMAWQSEVAREEQRQYRMLALSEEAA